MAPLIPIRRSALLASALAIACEAPGERPRRRADAAPRPATVDAAPRPTTADAPAPTPDAGPPRSPLDLFVVGGADLLRPGTVVRLRLERFVPGDRRPVDVTASATFTVEPAARATVDADGTLHAVAPGRALVTATIGADRARTIVDVFNELPAGTVALPTLRVSGDHVARSVHFNALPDGTVSLDVQAGGLSLALRGRRSGSVFPMTVPVRDASALDAGADAAAGVLVLERWAAGRLDGRASLRCAGEAIQLRFAVFFPDASPLRTPPP